MDVIDPDDLPIGVIRVDGAGRILDTNAVFAAWWGDRPLTGMPVTDVLVPADDFLDGAGSGAVMMTHAARPDRAALVTRREDADGAILTLIDASDRFAAGTALRRSHGLADRTRNRLELVIDASISFAAATTEERLADILAATTAQAYRAEESVVFLREGDRLHRAAGVNPFADEIDADEFTAAALQLHDVLRVSGHQEADAIWPALGDVMRRTGVQSLIAAPLHHEDEIFGLFACFFHHPRQFDQEAAPLADALAGQAAQTLVAVRLQHRLQHAATHDETTGLANRRLLEQQVDTLGRHQLAVLFIDLDGFKRINDTLGHLQGDEVLREVGRRLQAAVREGDLVARYGGDEFVVVARAAGETVAAEIAERLRLAVEAPYPSLPAGMRPAASIGVALGTVVGDTLPIDRLVRAADQAMYAAKNAGGNRVVTRIDSVDGLGVVPA